MLPLKLEQPSNAYAPIFWAVLPIPSIPVLKYVQPEKA